MSYFANYYVQHEQNSFELFEPNKEKSRKIFNCKLKTFETRPKAIAKKQLEKLVTGDIFNKSQTNKVIMNH